MAEEPRPRVRHPGGGKQMTVQSDALETDIGKIVERWINRGVVESNPTPPKYGDFSTSQDYFSALTAVKEAERDFGALPAAVRKACDNDPGKFVEIATDRDQTRMEELLKLGMPEDAVPDVDETPIPVVIAAAPATASSEEAPEGKPVEKSD